MSRIDSAGVDVIVLALVLSGALTVVMIAGTTIYLAPQSPDMVIRALTVLIAGSATPLFFQLDELMAWIKRPKVQAGAIVRFDSLAASEAGIPEEVLKTIEAKRWPAKVVDMIHNKCKIEFKNETLTLNKEWLIAIKN